MCNQNEINVFELNTKRTPELSHEIEIVQRMYTVHSGSDFASRALVYQKTICC